MFAPKHEIEKTPTFADQLATSEEQAARSRQARRPLALRLLAWHHSRNPYWNALFKCEYLLTLPFRLVAALIAAPFALHNRPLGATMSFLALHSDSGRCGKALLRSRSSAFMNRSA